MCQRATPIGSAPEIRSTRCRSCRAVPWTCSDAPELWCLWGPAIPVVDGMPSCFDPVRNDHLVISPAWISRSGNRSSCPWDRKERLPINHLTFGERVCGSFVEPPLKTQRATTVACFSFRPRSVRQRGQQVLLFRRCRVVAVTP